MILPLLLAIVGATAPPASLASIPAVAVVQDEKEEEEFPDNREEVEELIKALRGDAKRLGKADERAVATVKKLAAEFPRSGPRDRRAIAKELYQTMRVKRRIAKDGTRQRFLFLECSKSLAKMGPESVTYLIRLIDDRNHQDDYEVRCAVISALGQTKDEKAVKPLLALLDEFQARLQASAASALGNFGGIEQKVRKQIFEDLLKLLCSMRAALQDDANGSTINDRWRRVSGPAQKSMRKLSGANEGGAESWRRWWNKNKREDWDEE